MVEYFAGAGKVGESFRNEGSHRVASFELKDSKSMDFLSPSGYACLILSQSPCMVAYIMFWCAFPAPVDSPSQLSEASFDFGLAKQPWCFASHGTGMWVMDSHK